MSSWRRLAWLISDHLPLPFSRTDGVVRRALIRLLLLGLCLDAGRRVSQVLQRVVQRLLTGLCHRIPSGSLLLALGLHLCFGRGFLSLALRSLRGPDLLLDRGLSRGFLSRQFIPSRLLETAGPALLDA